MPATITVSRLSFSAPDGHALFSDLDLSFGPERTGLVGRNGVGKSTLLSVIAGDREPRSGSVAVSGTLAVLRQSLPSAPGMTIADLFGASEGLALLDRAARGEASVDELADADWTLEARLQASLDRFGLDVLPTNPLAALSGGQKTRAALAALVFAEPSFILLDEPTNNLDRDGRRAVIELLSGWSGGALIVSHDRELLETMDAIVELTGLGATRYGGNWTVYRERKTIELAAAHHDLADAERRAREQAHRAQQNAERKARRDGAGKRKRARGDMPGIALDAKADRSDRTSGANARLAEARMTETQSATEAARERIEILTPFSVSVPSSGLPSGRTVLQFQDLSYGFDAAVPLVRRLSDRLVGSERVALTGPNGVGKSTLLKVLTGALPPLAGEAGIFVPYALLDQDVTLLDPDATIRDNFRALNPDADENACRAALARFAFRADAALQKARTLSGGEKLRAGLAVTLGSHEPPQLLLLDEPTNHLDLDAIAAVEAGLAAYDGALLVVSHDEAFLNAIGITRRIILVGSASQA